MSITHYEFDNANADGDKEAVIPPNVPTLINKLIAHEANNLRDKLNEVIDVVNTIDTGVVTEPVLFTAPTTGINQEFELPPGFVAGSVLKSKGELFKGSEWIQTGQIVKVIVNVNTGNTIYIKP